MSSGASRALAACRGDIEATAESDFATFSSRPPLFLLTSRNVPEEFDCEIVIWSCTIVTDASFLLSPHTFVCRTSDHVVFLDLKRDAYSAVPPADVPLLTSLIHGWPSHPEEVPRSESHSGKGYAIALELEEADLITRDTRFGKSAHTVHTDAAHSTLWREFSDTRSVRLGELYNFMRAWWSVSYMVKRWPLSRTVERVRARRREQRWRTEDYARVSGLVSVYAALQPYAFSPVDACLRNSLTLVEYLAYYTYFPDWLFGVRLDPAWAAHSWVQKDDVVLNDTIEHISTYSPIMVV